MNKICYNVTCTGYFVVSDTVKYLKITGLKSFRPKLRSFERDIKYGANGQTLDSGLKVM